MHRAVRLPAARAAGKRSGNLCGVFAARNAAGAVRCDARTMGVIAALEGSTIEAAPGAQASCEVLVRNTGMVVDRVLLDVLGDANEWATVEPDQLNLLPGTGGSARITFRPPRASFPPAGPVPFALRVMSQEDPEGSVIEEGMVAVGSFTDISAELVPKTSHARRQGHHKLIVQNRGNAPAEVRLSAADPDDALEFRFKPEFITADPGTATFVKLRVAPRKRFLKGQSKSLPFQAFILPGEAEPVTAEGALLQRQIMPEWLLPALALAIVAGAALVALWFLVFKPEVHAAATQAVQQQTRSLASSAAKASQAASQANQAAANADAAAAGGGSGAGHKGASPSPPAGSSSSAPAPVPVSTLIPSDVPPGKTGTYTYKLKKPQTLTVSDVVLENPAGDTGTMKIQAGKTPLFEFGLADFRNLDYHFVQPLTFTAANPLEIVVVCTNTGTTKCTPALSFSGLLHK